MQALRNLEPRMKRVQDELAALQRQAQTLGSSGKAVPEFVRQDIEDRKLELAEMVAEKERHESQIQAIRVRYEADKKRYIELTQR
jgi:chromosome segregation ATPase